MDISFAKNKLFQGSACFVTESCARVTPSHRKALELTISQRLEATVSQRLEPTISQRLEATVSQRLEVRVRQ